MVLLHAVAVCTRFIGEEREKIRRRMPTTPELNHKLYILTSNRDRDMPLRMLPTFQDLHARPFSRGASEATFTHDQQLHVAGSNIWGLKCKMLECVVGFVLSVDSGVPSIRQLRSIQCSDPEDLRA